MKCTELQNYFILVFAFGGREGDTECTLQMFLDVYFGILCINRLKETVHYAVGKTLIFHKHFITLLNAKKETLLKYLNNYSVELLHSLQ